MFYFLCEVIIFYSLKFTIFANLCMLSSLVWNFILFKKQNKTKNKTHTLLLLYALATSFVKKKILCAFSHIIMLDIYVARKCLDIQEIYLVCGFESFQFVNTSWYVSSIMPDIFARNHHLETWKTQYIGLNFSNLSMIFCTSICLIYIARKHHLEI